MVFDFITTLKNIGISDQTDADEARYIRFTNVLTVICGLAIVAYAPYLYVFLPGSAALLSVVTAQSFLYAAALVFSYYRRHFLSRNVLCFNALICTAIESVLTNFYCDIHFFFLIGVIFAFFVFPEEERKYSYFISICFASAYIAIEAYLALAATPGLPSAYVMNTRHVIRSALLLLIFVFAFYAYRTIRGYQNTLARENEQMETEISLARNIQQQLIPMESPLECIHSLYRPMHMVGGDFYDFITFGGGNKIGIFLSDVSGHGVPAAFVTSMIKTAILQSGGAREDPAGLLSYLNGIIIQQSGGNFVTAFYGIYDTDARSIRFSNAGHNPPFIIDSLGIRELSGAKSLPLAVFNEKTLEGLGKKYTNSDTALEPGSKVLFYTDGLTEARSKIDVGSFFEREGMIRSFNDNRNLSSGEFIANVYRDLVSYHGGENFDDDICMICLDVVQGIRHAGMSHDR